MIGLLNCVWIATAFAAGLFLQYFLALLFLVNPDSSDTSDKRRRLHNSRRNFPSNVLHQEYWTPNSRGMLLYRQSFVPKSCSIRAVIGMCHGYNDFSSGFLSEVAIKFCAEGFAVIMMDCEGHGKSDGLHCFIEDMNFVYEDYFLFFKNEMQKKEYSGRPFFLLGESMGGAIVFNLCLLDKDRALVNGGAVLLAPMLKVADSLKPPTAAIFLLKMIAKVCPIAPITPIANMDYVCFKRPDALVGVLKDPLHYSKLLRLGTAGTLHNTTEEIPKHMERFNHPVLIFHGDLDKVTCPDVSKEFF